MIILIGIFGGIGVFLMMVSYRMTNHINLGPFHYFGINISFILGWIFFKETPFDELFPGIVFIVLAGFIIYWREKIKSSNKQLPTRFKTPIIEHLKAEMPPKKYN